MIWIGILLLGSFYGALSAIPTGPVGVLILRNTLRGKPRTALASLGGLVIAQFLYVVVLIIGLEGWIFSRPLLWHSLAFAGASIVLALGVKTLLFVRKSFRKLSTENETVVISEGTYGRHVVTTFTITLTNPAVFFVLSNAVSIYASVFGQLPDASRLTIYLMAVQVGVLCWFLALISLLSRLADKPAVRVSLQRHLEHISGWILTAFGIYLLGREVAAFWELFA